MPDRQASIALIRHHDEPEQHWLSFWDAAKSHFSFVTAERLESESWRECLDRELAWQLDLRRCKDYLISSMARLHFEETEIDPNSNDESKLEVEFYIVDPYGRKGREAFAGLSNSKWLSNKELMAGRCDDDRHIDQWLVQLLQKADLLPKG